MFKFNYKNTTTTSFWFEREVNDILQEVENSWGKVNFIQLSNIATHKRKALFMTPSKIYDFCH